jgi:hypothetical protein
MPSVRSVRDARGVISQNLDTVESGADIAIESAKEVVHELRGNVQEVAGETLNQVRNSWDQKQTRIERYMSTIHGWCLGFFFSSHTSSRESMRASNITVKEEEGTMFPEAEKADIGEALAQEAMERKEALKARTMGKGARGVRRKVRSASKNKLRQSRKAA